MARSSRRISVPSDLIDVEAPSGASGAKKMRGYTVPPEDAADAAEPGDLLDVEAPPAGGAMVDTVAYAAPSTRRGRKPRTSAPPASPASASLEDLVDVEAPPAGGAAVDTAAYAAPGVREADGEASPASGSPSLIDAQAPPPPSGPGGRASGVDPLAGEAGGAPAPAGTDLGGAPATSAADGDVLERAGAAALRLAADRPWPEVTLRDVAQAAGVSFAALYARAPGRRALLLALSATLDQQALERSADDTAPAARDRLFEAFMSRLDVMGPHRDVLIAIGRSEGAALAPALPRTVRALAEGAGVDTSGGRGALRLLALTAAWARTLQVWRDDEGALNRTMAEIDKLLTRADARLKRVGAGF